MKDMCTEKQARLREVLELFRLHKDLEDLEQWIQERTVTAGSHDTGLDLEHVLVSFSLFAFSSSSSHFVGFLSFC